MMTLQPSTLESVIFIIAIIIAFFVVYIFANIILELAYGQDVEPCFVRDNEMYQRICDKQEIDKVLESLLERARQWNNGSR